MNSLPAVHAEPPLIQAESLTKRYGSLTAVDRASFSVAKGRIAGFLGLNGAGKTTTMRMIACFQPPTSGSVRVAGKDTVQDSEAVRERIGYLPERVPLYEDATVLEYLRFRARLKGVRGAALKQRLDHVISRMGLEDRRHQLIGTLSKGFRQRTGFADALVHDPELLILDEPTSGLDPDQRIEMRRLIKELGAERTVLLSTHILSEAEAVCDDIVVIHRGRIRASAPLQELCAGRGGAHVLITASDAQRTRTQRFDAEAAAQAALSQAVQQGQRVIEFRARAQTLEEVFIGLTTAAEEGR